MDRIGRDMRISTLKVDVDNNKIVEVIELFPDLRFGDPTSYTAHDEVSCCASSDLI